MEEEKKKNGRENNVQEKLQRIARIYALIKMNVELWLEIYSKRDVIRNEALFLNVCVIQHCSPVIKPAAQFNISTSEYSCKHVNGIVYRFDSNDA